MTRVEIDLNVRLAGGSTFAGLEDVDGPIFPGAQVEVFESESGVAGAGEVLSIDDDQRLVYLSVDWATIREESGQPTPKHLTWPRFDHGDAGSAVLSAPNEWAAALRTIDDCAFSRRLNRPTSASWFSGSGTPAVMIFATCNSGAPTFVLNLETGAVNEPEIAPVLSEAHV